MPKSKTGSNWTAAGETVAAKQSKNSRKATAVSPQKQPVVKRSTSGNRILNTPQRSWRHPKTWQYRSAVPDYRPLPKARQILIASLRQLRANWKLFGGIALVYGILNIILVRGLSGSNNLVTFKANLSSVFHGVGGQLASSATGFLYLLGTSGSGSSDTSGIYQVILIVLCSLAFIWALRQTMAKNRVRIRDSFYAGMYPLVPFLLVFLVIGIQLLPLAIGGGLYTTVISAGIAVHVWEKLLWLGLFIGLGLWSLRMITGSLFALYIVSLPDMTPLRALRSGRQLVYGRRLLIWRKLLFLPIVLLLVAAVIELPLIVFITALAPWIFFVFSTAALALVHGYLYNLYREML